MTRQTTVLVTGGAGYVGSHTCKELARQGYRVVVYDNLSTGHRDLVRWGYFEHGDILDTQRLQHCLKRYKVEGVVHFAAKAYVGESVADPALYFRNNVSGTLSILEAMCAVGVPRIVVSSTCSVYGQPGLASISEDTPPKPINPYGASKLFMERMLADFEVAHGLRWMALRYFNAAGCDPDGETGERHIPETHLIPRALMAVAGHAPGLQVFGRDYPSRDGTCVRDYVHVSDLAVAHVAALAYVESGSSGVVNLGSGVGYSVQEILSGVAQATGRVVPSVDASRRAGDPAVLVAEVGRARNMLGWLPVHSDMAYILSTAWEWFQRDKSRQPTV